MTGGVPVSERGMGAGGERTSSPQYRAPEPEPGWLSPELAPGDDATVAIRITPTMKSTMLSAPRPMIAGIEPLAPPWLSTGVTTGDGVGLGVGVGTCAIVICLVATSAGRKFCVPSDETTCRNICPVASSGSLTVAVKPPSPAEVISDPSVVGSA